MTAYTPWLDAWQSAVYGLPLTHPKPAGPEGADWTAGWVAGAAARVDQHEWDAAQIRVIQPVRGMVGRRGSGRIERLNEQRCGAPAETGTPPPTYHLAAKPQEAIDMVMLSCLDDSRTPPDSLGGI